MENGRCDMHGGKSVRGIAHHAHKGKGRSKYFPPIDILNFYLENRDNPELLNMTEEAALLSARVQQLLEKLESEESQGRWKSVDTNWKEFKKALSRGDKIAMGEFSKEINNAIRQGQHDYMVWDDIFKAMRELRQTISQEQKRRMEMNALISTEDAIAFVSEILSVVKENVSDQKELTKIYMAAQTAMTRRPGMMQALRQDAERDEEPIEAEVVHDGR